MSYIPDCRTDEYYNEKYLNEKDKEFVIGFDYCTQVAVECGFANIEDFFDEFKIDVRPSDIGKVTEAVEKWLLDWIESQRNELITSMLDDMSDEEYKQIKSKVNGKPFSYADVKKLSTD